MAYFAQLDENSKVIQVISVNNDVVTDGNGDEQESLGITFLQNLYGSDTTWKQTSYNTHEGKYYNAPTDPTVASSLSDDQSKAFRGNYAGIGDTYDSVNDIFYPDRPEGFNSWTLNTSKAKWEAPITYPSVVDDGADPSVWGYSIYWDEDAYQADNTTGWKATRNDDDGDPQTVYSWDGSSWNAT